MPGDRMPGEDGEAPPSRRISVALVNDYELVVRGVAEMLRPFRDRIEVVELDVAHNPDFRVDLALFDPYGNARLGLDRVSSLASDPKVGQVAIYTWTLTGEQREEALAAARTASSPSRCRRTSSWTHCSRSSAGGEFVSSEFGVDEGPPWPGHDFGLTLRESEVAALLAVGMSNKEMRCRTVDQ